MPLSAFLFAFMAALPASAQTAAGHASPVAYAEEALEVWKSSLAVVRQDSTKAVALYLHYANRSASKIVKESVEVSITDPEGKLLFQKTFDDTIVLEPGQKFENPTYYSFKDNAFVKNEPADRLWPVAKAGTARITALISKVTLEDGTVLLPKYPPPATPKPR